MIDFFGKIYAVCYKKAFFGLFLIASLLCAPLSFAPERLLAQTTPPLTITSNTTWISQQSPYIISGYFLVPAGVTLTIEKGVTVKFYKNRGATIEGNLVVHGTSDQPVTFTSLYDDSVGGATSPDTTQLPKPGFWSSIAISETGSMTMTNGHIRYAGYESFTPVLGYQYIPLALHQALAFSNPAGALKLFGGSATITDSVISNNIIGIQPVSFEGSWHSQVSIHNSTIADNTQAGIVVYGEDGESDVDATQNWWGDNSGPFHFTLNRLGKGNKIDGTVSFIPWTTHEQAKRPVIIIPGMLGSELYDQNELIWPDLSRMLTDVGDEFLTEHLKLDENGASVSSSIKIKDALKEIRLSIPELNINRRVLDIFGNFVLNLESHGYRADTSYFLFPYDWRLNLDDSLDALHKKIETIKATTGFDSVDVVAHSMGGLLAKNYINAFGKNDFHKLIFVGTPHLGAPKAGKVLLGGDQFNIPWLNGGRMKELAQNSVSSYELLPNQTYVDTFSGYIKKPSLFGSGPLTYAQTKEFLLSKNLNPAVFQKAENFFSKHLEAMDFSGIATYNIAGCKSSTQAGYGFALNGNITTLAYTSGDQTVPLASASYISLPATNKFYVKNAEHSELPSLDGVRDLILSLLTDKPSALPSFMSNDTNFCAFKGKTLTWRSPVEVHIYDALGNHTGPIENGIEYGIKGVGYEIVDNEKFVFLPTDEGQIYNIKAKGLDKGTFDLLIGENDNGVPGVTNIFNDVPIATSTVVTFPVSQESMDSTIQIDAQGTGSIQAVQASAMLNGEASQDIVAPQTSASLSGVAGTNGWYKSKVSVALSAIDDSAGILSTKYSLDGGATFQPYAQPFDITREGVSTIAYFSIDNAGNNEEIHFQDIKIDKTPPEISAAFNLQSKNFAFSASDAQDVNPNISCNVRSCTAQDGAGNTTAIGFKKFQSPGLSTLLLSDISYNGIFSSFFPNELAVTFQEKKGAIEHFDQTFTIKKQERVRIKYERKRDESKITLLLKGDGLSKQVFPGIKILQIITENKLIKTIIN